MSGYMGLSDVGGEVPSETATVAVKFCSLGLVTSQKWTGIILLCYVML